MISRALAMVHRRQGPQTNPCFILLPRSATSSALSVQMWSPSASVCITWMGAPLSISAFSFSREGAFKSLTFTCFLHVGQYNSTFMVRMIASGRAIILPCIPSDTAFASVPAKLVGGRLCSAASLTSSPRTTRQEKTPSCVVPLPSLVRSAATRRAARSTPSNAQDAESSSATIAPMSTAALPRRQVK